MSRETARQQVRVAVDGCGMTRVEFAREAGLDVGTLGDFLSGKRWAQKPNLRKIERVLGWASGRIDELEQDVPVRSAAALDVLDAIERDPSLLPEAKEHLLRQYRLLLRVTPEPPQNDRQIEQDQALGELDTTLNRRRRRRRDDPPR